MIRLRCDHLGEFIAGRRIFYTADYGHPHKKEDEVILYDNYYEHKFKIMLIQFGRVLALRAIKDEKE